MLTLMGLYFMCGSLAFMVLWIPILDLLNTIEEMDDMTRFTLKIMLFFYWPVFIMLLLISLFIDRGS